MRIRRYVVLKFYAEQEPYDFIERMSSHFTKQWAENVRKLYGPSLEEYMAGAEGSSYFRVMKLPKKIPRRQRPRYERPVPET